MTKIHVTTRTADDEPYGNAYVTVRLVDAGAGASLSGGVSVAPRTIKTDADGEAIIDLTPSADVTPAGTFYAFTVNQSSPTVVRYLEVPAPNGSGNSEVPYEWDDESIQRLVPDPPYSYPAPGSGDVGDVATIVDSGDGKRIEFQPGTPIDTDPRLLSPASWVGPQTAAGLSALIDIGSDGANYEPEVLASGVVPANAWTGKRIFDQFSSTVGSAGYPEAGVEVTVEGWYIPSRVRDPSVGVFEPFTVHAYTDGDGDETHDYLEPWVVQQADGLHLALDIRLNDVLPKYTCSTTAAVLEFDRDYDSVRWALDPATGEVEFFVNGVSVETVALERTDNGSAPSLPCVLSVPASTVDILAVRNPMAIRRVTVTEFGETDLLMLFDADDATEGASSFTSTGRTWSTAYGVVTGPFPVPVLPKSVGPWESTGIQVGATESATWILAGMSTPFAAVAEVWWGRNAADALMETGPGWAFGAADGLFTFGFIASDGSTLLGSDSGALLAERGTVAAVLDRGTDELRLYTYTPADGLVLADTVDATGFGAIGGTGPVQLSADLTGGAGFYRRALTAAELEHLARNAPPLPVAAPGSAGATTDASELTTGTLPFARLPIGTTSTTVPAGNDSRFSDARTPTAHKTSHATGGSDALAPSDIGAVPTSRQIAGLDLTADRDAAALRAALALGTAYPLDSDTDAALTAASDSKVATQKATKSYVDARFPIHRSATTSRRISTKGSFNTGAAEGMTTTGDRVYAPIFLPAGTYNTLSVRSTTAGTSTWRLGIFNGASGDPTRPGTVLKDAGTIDLSVTAAMLTLSSLNFTIPADGWYWCCAQVETYTSTPQLVCAFADSKTDLLFPGWPGQEGNYLRAYCGYQDLSPSAGALTTANAITGNALTGLDYAGNVPRFWVGP